MENKKIRLLRILEYTYDDPERYLQDIKKWSVAANGFHVAGTLTIKSATMPVEQVIKEDKDA